MVELLDSVAKAVACNRLMSGAIELGSTPFAQPAIIGNSRVMQGVYKEIGRVAATAVPVLIRRETGTGKELAQGNQAKAARWLGVARTTMREKLIHFGLRRVGERSDETD